MPNTEIEALEQLGDEIATLSAHIEVATARLLDLIRDFDARGGWTNGFKSCADWLSWRVGLNLTAAYERVRVARALPGLPLIRAAFAAADISYFKVRALTRVATHDTEERLLKFARFGTAAHVERLDPGAPGERYQVVVHVDAPVLADPDQPGQSVLEDGAYSSAEESRRIACDAGRVVMRHDADGRLTEIGARTRTIPPALRRALQHRDQGCRFPGCGSRFTQGHHIRHWANGGPTTLSNLALLCRRHHRTVHEEGFQVSRLASGELEFRRPNGWVFPEVPPPASVEGDSERVLRAAVDRHTLRPSWDGTRLNLGDAIEVMHPRARRPSPDVRAEQA